MTPADRLAMLAALGLEVELAVAPDGREYLRVRGPEILRDAARPTLARHRDALIAHLRRTAPLKSRDVA